MRHRCWAEEINEVVKTTMAVVGGQPKAAAGFRALPGMQQHHAITARAGIGLAPAIRVNFHLLHCD